MKKVVVFLADGFEEIEALSPVDYLRRAGAQVTTVSIAKSNRAVDGAHGITVNADMTFDTYLSSMNELPDAVVVPGGMPGASNIAGNVRAISFIDEMKDGDRLICAICASPAIVLSKTECVLKGKKWTCYPGMADNAECYVSGHVDDVPFVHDGNLITGKGPGAAEEFSMEIVRTLFGDEVAKKVSTAACMR